MNYEKQKSLQIIEIIIRHDRISYKTRVYYHGFFRNQDFFLSNLNDVILLLHNKVLTIKYLRCKKVSFS